MLNNRQYFIEYTTQLNFYPLNRVNKPIYLLPNKPIDPATLALFAHQGAYIIMPSDKGIRIYAFDKEMRLRPFLQNDEMEKIAKIIEANPPGEKGVDFYYMHQLPYNPVDYIQNVQGKNELAYLLTPHSLLLIDKVANKYLSISIEPSKIKELKKNLKIHLDEDVMIGGKSLNEYEIKNFFPAHHENIEKLRDPLRPLQESMDSKKHELILGLITLEINKINAYTSTTDEVIPFNEQYTYFFYRATVNPQYYPSNHGDFLSGTFLTLEEEKNNISIQSIDENLKNAIEDKEWIQNNIQDIIGDTLLDPNFDSNLIINSIINFAHLHLCHLGAKLPASGTGMADTQMILAKTTHQQLIIGPRSNKAYFLSHEIAVDEFRYVGEQGSKIAAKFALGNPSTNLAEIYIISDVRPGQIIHDNGLKITSEINTETSTFIFFTEEDAKECIKKICKNHHENSALINCHIPSLQVLIENIQDENLKERLIQFFITEYSHIINMFTEGLAQLVSRQEQYRNDYCMLDSEGLNVTEGRKNQYLALTAQGEYMHFAKIEKIYHILNMLKDQVETLAHELNNNKKIFEKLEKINELDQFIINNLQGELKRYVYLYPYKNHEDSLIHLLLYSIKKLSDYLPKFIRKEEKNLIKEYKNENNIILLFQKAETHIFVSEAMKLFYAETLKNIESNSNYQDASTLEKSHIRFEIAKKITSLNSEEIYANRQNKNNQQVDITEIEKRLNKYGAWDKFISDILYNADELPATFSSHLFKRRYQSSPVNDSIFQEEKQKNIK